MTTAEKTTDGLCQCGCGQRTNLAPQTRAARGWIKGQPKRFVMGHNRRLFRGDQPYVEEGRGYATPCWVWMGAADGHGYGRRWNGERVTTAHRYYWELANGPVPDGLHLDHLCGQPSCVNPDHLEPVTQAENTRRAARLTPEAVSEIRHLASTSGLLQRELAERFGVTAQHVGQIVLGRRWSA